MRSAQPVAPEQAGAGAWDRLAGLESFGFTLAFHTDRPFPIRVRFSGRHEKPDREAWSGYMARRSDVSRVELRAEGGDQYEKEPSGWRRTMRSIETQVLEQGAGVFRASGLAFAGAEGRRYRYTFKPDLPILDPTRSKKLSGVMEVDPRSGLPVRLYCADSARTAEWELTLGRFNRAGPVSVPYQPAMIVDASPARSLNRADHGLAVGILKQRLARLGWDYRLSRAGPNLKLLLGQAKTRQQVELRLSRGRVEVWQGQWAQAETLKDPEAVVLEVGGDASRRVTLGRLLGDNGRTEFSVRVAAPLAAVLETSVALPDTGHPAVLVVDGRALSAAKPDVDGRLLFADIGGEDEVRVIAALTAYSPMPVGFRVSVKP